MDLGNLLAAGFAALVATFAGPYWIGACAVAPKSGLGYAWNTLLLLLLLAYWTVAAVMVFVVTPLGVAMCVAAYVGTSRWNWAVEQAAACTRGRA